VRSSGVKASAAALVKVLLGDCVEGVQSLAKFEGLLAVFCYMTPCHLVYRDPSFVVSRSEEPWSSPGLTLRGIVVDPKDLVSTFLRYIDNYQMTWRCIPQGLKYGVPARSSVATRPRIVTSPRSRDADRQQAGRPAHSSRQFFDFPFRPLGFLSNLVVKRPERSRI